MKKQCAVWVLVLLALAVFPRDGGATEAELVLATFDRIPPFVFRSAGKLTGLSIDIIQELARRGNFHCTIEAYPWARVLAQLETGKVDGAFSAYKTENREEYCIYIGLIHYDELKVATRRDTMFTYTGIESLYGKVVGKGRSVFVGEAFNKAVRDGRIILAETNDLDMSNIRKLHAGRLDAVIGSPIALRHSARKLGLDGEIVLLSQPIREKIPAYLVLSRRSQLKDKEAWAEKLRTILAGMYADGTVQAIRARYGEVEP